MRSRKRQPARPVPRPVSRATWRLRRWAAAGRELERCDPRRLGSLLVLAEQVLRTHRKRRERDLKVEIRRRFGRR